MLSFAFANDNVKQRVAKPQCLHTRFTVYQLSKPSHSTIEGVINRTVFTDDLIVGRLLPLFFVVFVFCLAVTKPQSQFHGHCRIILDHSLHDLPAQPVFDRLEPRAVQQSPRARNRRLQQ